MAVTAANSCPAGTMTWAVSACNAAVVMFRMKSLCLSATVKVSCRLSVVDTVSGCKRWSLHASFLPLGAPCRTQTLRKVHSASSSVRVRSELVSSEPNHSGGAFEPAMVFTSIGASLIVTFFAFSSSDCKVSSSWSSLHAMV